MVIFCLLITVKSQQSIILHLLVHYFLAMLFNIHVEQLGWQQLCHNLKIEHSKHVISGNADVKCCLIIASAVNTVVTTKH